MDLTGQRFGRLVVQHLDPHRGSGGQKRWYCLCDCGAATIVATEILNRGNATSCGCLKAEVRKTHGQSATPEYNAWGAMIQRCTNPKNQNYPNYGGRGITVADRWRSFEAFQEDMGPRPGPEYSVERRDVNGNYEPGNCTWATPTEQANNKRGNLRVEIDGEVLTSSQVEQRYGISPATLSRRLSKGATGEEAVKPLSSRGRSRGSKSSK